MADKRGEWGPTMDATEDNQEICDQVKDEVEKKTGKVYMVFRAVKYRKWIYIPQMCGAPLQFLIKTTAPSGVSQLWATIYKGSVGYLKQVRDLVTMAATPGGFGETQNATGDIQKICDQVKSQAEGKTNKKYQEFKAVKYRSQTVAGKNYLIKVHVGGSSYLVLRVFQNLPCNGGAVVLQGVKEEHQKDAPIIPF